MAGIERCGFGISPPANSLATVPTRSSIFDLDFSPDGTRWLTATTGNLTGLEDPAITVWDSDSKREILDFQARA